MIERIKLGLYAILLSYVSLVLMFFLLKGVILTVRFLSGGGILQCY